VLNHEVLSHEVLSHEVLNHEVLNHEVLNHEVLSHEAWPAANPTSCRASGAGGRWPSGQPSSAPRRCWPPHLVRF
jgi:hypothetical protein